MLILELLLNFSSKPSHKQHPPGFVYKIKTSPVSDTPSANIDDDDDGTLLMAAIECSHSFLPFAAAVFIIIHGVR